MSAPTTPTRRGHPTRIRRPNPRIFGDDSEPEPPRHSISKSRKSAKSSHLPSSQINPLKAVLSTPDKKAAASIGFRLRNLLKLPKAHRWVCYEWFYSNIDIPLFAAENDFTTCLKVSFPQLKTRMLTRREWCKIRRLMGKPRRCSAAFFAEERAVLQRKREKIRTIQQRKDVNNIDLKDLPAEIPLALSIGTKVTARLRYPQDGLFTGMIDALNTIENTYRITFDKQGLGTYSVPDIEVLSNDGHETIPLLAFQAQTRKHRPASHHFLSPTRYLAGPNSPGLLGVSRPAPNFLSPVRYSSDPSSPGLMRDHDPLLGSSPMKVNLGNIEEGQLGGFPIKFLVLITRLTSILQMKKQKVKKLKEMNTEAEKMKAQMEPLLPSFQQRYAAVILELETLNKEVNSHLRGITDYSQELCPDAAASALDSAPALQQDCHQEAREMVTQNNQGQNNRKMMRNTRMLDLITKLTSLLLQIRTFGENEHHSFEFKSLEDAVSDIKKSIDPSNHSVFQNHVEVHVNHVLSGLNHMGNLHAFHNSQIGML